MAAAAIMDLLLWRLYDEIRHAYKWSGAVMWLTVSNGHYQEREDDDSSMPILYHDVCIIPIIRSSSIITILFVCDRCIFTVNLQRM
jgi:hypothetical protein